MRGIEKTQMKNLMIRKRGEVPIHKIKKFLRPTNKSLILMNGNLQNPIQTIKKLIKPIWKKQWLTKTQTKLEAVLKLRRIWGEVICKNFKKGGKWYLKLFDRKRAMLYIFDIFWFLSNHFRVSLLLLHSGDLSSTQKTQMPKDEDFTQRRYCIQKVKPRRQIEVGCYVFVVLLNDSRWLIRAW